MKSDPIKSQTTAIALTQRERLLIRRALVIASEDGSIYGTADSEADQKKINAEIEAIERKLS